jgi:hypothetical protein
MQLVPRDPENFRVDPENFLEASRVLVALNAGYGGHVGCWSEAQ